MTEPKVKVGILFEPEIEFVLLAPYRIDGCEVSGAQTVTCRNGQIVWQDRMYDELRFELVDALSGSFEIRNVVLRSEERRVGKECRSRWSPYH